MGKLQVKCVFITQIIIDISVPHKANAEAIIGEHGASKMTEIDLDDRRASAQTSVH